MDPFDQAAGVSLRAVREDDLAEFFVHQRDSIANQMAAFPPRNHEAFMAHWRKILADPTVIARTILFQTQVAGNALCWQQEGQRLVGYWLGRDFWGRGIASRAVSAFVASISARPLHAYVARRNPASIRVLEKAGFRCCGERRAAAATGGEAVDELVYIYLTASDLAGGWRRDD